MKKIIPILVSCSLCLLTAAQEIYTVNINETKAKVSPNLWGLFFEDINRGADGGVYAEMIKNRSFDFPNALTGWTTLPDNIRDGIFLITNQLAANTTNPKYLTVTVGASDKAALSNEGFGGITLKKELRYNCIIRYRQQIPGINIRLKVVNNAGKLVGSVLLIPSRTDKEWQTQELNFITTDTAINGKLVLQFNGSGKIDIDLVSMFPSDTWKGRSGGLRADLVQKLADMKPGFLRFPGGCIVEGQNLNERYQWKKTIGPVEDRQLLMNIWNQNIEERKSPDYYQSFGLGFLEYFQLCEDLGAAPMPMLNCGMSCQFHDGETVPLDQLDPYIQDALDLVEFANGDTTTTWGARRAALGHPITFNMNMLGVGNENWGPQYVERLQLFTKAIKDKYPAIKIIASSGYAPGNPQFQFLDSALRAMNIDIIDEHYYRGPDWFLQNTRRYDNYNRKGPKILVGEYAAQSVRVAKLDNKNDLRCALSEAAFMTGLERNADVITMASYAPLFAHTKDWQWTPNLLWFDNVQSYGTPNYYVQQLFSLNKGTDVVPLLLNGQPVAGQDSSWASAVLDKNTNELIIKLVNPSATAKQKIIDMPALKKVNTSGTITILKGNKPTDVNSMENPMAMAPVTSEIKIKKKQIVMDVAPWSFSVVRVKM